MKTNKFQCLFDIMCERNTIYSIFTIKLRKYNGRTNMDKNKIFLSLRGIKYTGHLKKNATPETTLFSEIHDNMKL